LKKLQRNFGPSETSWNTYTRKQREVQTQSRKKRTYARPARDFLQVETISIRNKENIPIEKRGIFRTKNH